jgi:hypothetical protein
MAAPQIRIPGMSAAEIWMRGMSGEEIRTLEVNGEGEEIRSARSEPDGPGRTRPGRRSTSLPYRS